MLLWIAVLLHYLSRFTPAALLKYSTYIPITARTLACLISMYLNHHAMLCYQISRAFLLEKLL